MSKFTVDFDARDYLYGYGEDGAIESAMGDVLYALYHAIAEARMIKPIDDDAFCDAYYDSGNAGEFRSEAILFFKAIGLYSDEDLYGKGA